MMTRIVAMSMLAGFAGTSATGTPGGLDEIAPAYVKLVLALGVHDADYVDAYYGPPAWRAAAQAEKRPLSEIRSDAAGLLVRLAALRPDGRDELLALRHEYLTRQLEALATRVDMLSGAKLTFDEESRALYNAVAPPLSDGHFQQILARLEPLLPGPGTLSERYDAYGKRFVIPPDRLSAVFEAAIAECRRRTLPHVDLPASETFTVEYVKGKPWSAYNWYQGGFRSVIQVNQDLPVPIDRAVDLACHEGYPGHHVYNALLAKHLVKDRGWVEFSVYALFSPQSLIAEGTANYGIRSYVLNYNLGRDLARAYVEKRAATTRDRWAAFKALLASPRLPGGLK